MTITDPTTPPLLGSPTPLAGFPQQLHSYTNIVPFTYRSGLTYQEVLEGLRAWLRDIMVPHIDDEFTEFTNAWNTEVTSLVADVNTALSTWQDTSNTAIADMVTYVNTSVQSIINSTIAVTDPVTLAIFNDLASATRVALDAQYAPKATTYSKTQSDTNDAATLTSAEGYTDTKVAGVVQVNEHALTPYRYGALAPTAANDNTTALVALFAAASAGGANGGATIYLPPGIWRTTQALPIFNGLVLKGAGRTKSQLSAIGTNNLFEWSINATGVHIEDIRLDTVVAGKGVFSPQGNGGLYGSTINNCFLYAGTDTSWIWQQVNAGSFIHITVRDTEMQRTVGSTVVPFQIINSGGGANFNRLDNVRINGYNNVNTPFIHIESSLAGSYLTDWVITGLLGEQNPGGMLRVLGANNWTVINATDEDSTVDYTGNIIDFQNGASSLAPRNVTIMNSGRRGRQMTAGKFDIAVSLTGYFILVNACNPSTSSQNSVLQLPAQAVVMNTRGYPLQYVGAGTPVNNIAAAIGSTYIRTDGGAGSTFYVKESGLPTDVTGWVAK